MKCKVFEIRDCATCMPALAIKLSAENVEQRFLFGRAGFGSRPEQYVLLHFLEVGGIEYDSFNWPQTSRTRKVAHDYIAKHFDVLEEGAVVDVEFILGEKPEPKQSERYDRAGGL